MNSFETVSTPIAGLTLLQRTRHRDERGHFEKIYDSEDLSRCIDGPIRQINRARTVVKGTVRGMHVQLHPHAETKIVSCLKGRVFDVAVDLRSNSVTFGHWYGAELSESNQMSMVIPPGCAHGVQTLENESEILYLHTASYHPELEIGIHPCDSQIGIAWPLPVEKLSKRDMMETKDLNYYEGVSW